MRPRIRIVGRMAAALVSLPVAIGDPVMLGAECLGTASHPEGNGASLYRVREVLVRNRDRGRSYTVVLEEDDL